MQRASSKFYWSQAYLFMDEQKENGEELITSGRTDLPGRDESEVRNRQMSHGPPRMTAKKRSSGHDVPGFLTLGSPATDSSQSLLASDQSTSSGTLSCNRSRMRSFLTNQRRDFITAKAENICVKWLRIRLKWSATPITARKELYTAEYVDSNIMATAPKAWTMPSMDWKAWREFSWAIWAKLFVE